MATRSRTSFQKRQKEIARAEKQRDKLAKRAARKLAPRAPEDELAVLEGPEIHGFDDPEGEGPEEEGPAAEHHE